MRHSKEGNKVRVIAAMALMLAACGSQPAGDAAAPEEAGRQEEHSRSVAYATAFEDADTGALPHNWSQGHTGEGEAEWKVVDDGGNRVLAQVRSGNPVKHFNMAVYDGLEAADVTLSVRLKAVRGFYDQGGGLIWRYLDENNHYIVRANPLENNVVLYKMENGIRTDLPLAGLGRTYGIETDTMGFAWHTLKVEAAGSMFTVFFDDRQLFRVVDSTFTRPGKTGLWTKADAVTYFDDFEALNR